MTWQRLRLRSVTLLAAGASLWLGCLGNSAYSVGGPQGGASGNGGSSGVAGSGAPGTGGSAAGPAAPTWTLPSPGVAPLRRLNRFEYNNTVRDLLGDTSNPANQFVPDGVAYGFDTLADSLVVTQELAEQFMHAAETLSAAIDITQQIPCTPTAANAQACPQAGKPAGLPARSGLPGWRTLFEAEHFGGR